jgi:hypothetical protein
MRGRVVFALMAAAMAWGCATSGSSGSGLSGGSAGGSRSSSGGQDIITEADINSRAADASNALQVIQKLRPQMLRGRGLAVLPNEGRTAAEATGASLPKVYIDNIAYGDLNSLSNVNASQIREIRYLNARDATTQWGTGHLGGVILVLTKK